MGDCNFGGDGGEGDGDGSALQEIGSIATTVFVAISAESWK
jgi:hypothetical protein